MIRPSRAIAALVLALVALSPAFAATETALIMPSGPSVAVTGAATGTVQNDRMQAMVRVEADHANATTAAAEVNTRMAKALARAKAVAGVETKSAGYSTWQTWEKGKPSKWKVVQSLALTATDFPALASLVSKLQDEDGLLISGIVFSIAPETRRKSEDALTREAVRAWQQRAATASDALGYGSWRPGRVTISSGDMMVQPRQDMMMRAQAAPGAAPPVAVEGGTTEITVTVTGDAQLDNLKTR